jgi:hypothetical protein
VKEEGEVSKDLAIAEMKVGFKTSFKDSMKREAILSFLYYSPVQYQRTFHRKLKNRIEHRVVTMRKWRHALGARNTA